MGGRVSFFSFPFLCYCLENGVMMMLKVVRGKGRKRRGGKVVIGPVKITGVKLFELRFFPDFHE